MTGYATIGVTWKHGVTYAEDQITIQVRTLEQRRLVEVDEGRSTTTTTAPTATSSEEESARERPGTDALVIGDVDQVQMRATTADGIVPPDLKLALIDPGTGKMTKQAPAIDTAKLPSAKGDAGDGRAAGLGQTARSRATGTQDTVTLSAMTRAPKPTIYSRAQWGANEKMREQTRAGATAP